MVAVVLLNLIALSGCQHLGIDTEKLFRPAEVSEIVGFLAGLGTTFAALPDLLAMLRRRSSEGINPRMGAIMGTFQILWVYYGLLIASVIIWNVIAILMNFLTVGAYAYYLHREKQAHRALVEWSVREESMERAIHLMVLLVVLPSFGQDQGPFGCTTESRHRYRCIRGSRSSIAEGVVAKSSAEELTWVHEGGSYAS
jgi:uncharacterized protein with PQ loop repeat